MIHVFVAPIPTTSPSPAAGSSRAVAYWVAVRGFGTKVAGLSGVPRSAERFWTSSKLSGS